MSNDSLPLVEVISTLPGYDPFAQSDGFIFDEAAAQRACEFFPKFLTHIKGDKAATPFHLENWQRAIVANLFGWKDQQGRRRYRECFVEVPRKAGKSTLAAGLALFCLFCDGEKGAEIYSAAADREQASLVFDCAKAMTANCESLKKRSQIYTKSIVYGSSFYKVVSSEVYGKHGQNPSCLLIDELHCCNRDFVEVLTTGTGARSSPLIIYITTSDYANNESICNEKLKYALRVRSNEMQDPRFLPVIYRAEIDDDWTSPAVWAKAQPNLGVSVSLEFMERECKKALEMPSYENVFKRLFLNIQTETDVRWIPLHLWDKCNKPFDTRELIGKRCIAGLDLSTTTDISALVLWFPEFKTCLPFFFMPKESAVNREKRDGVPYSVWARQGAIEFSDGNVIDYDLIKRRIQELSKVYRISEIAYDPWNASQIALDLQDKLGFKMIEFRQGFISMNEPSKEFERLIVSGELNHLNNPVLRSMAGAVSVRTDPAGNIKPDKQKSTERIDGIVALIMGIGRAMVTKDSKSIYEQRGVIRI